MEYRKKMSAQPEGPFETIDRIQKFGVSNDKMSRFLDFISQMGLETKRSLSLRDGYDETPILVTLLRNHLSGKLTTMSSLAQHSGLSYGTAVRAINGIENRGMIIRRPRTITGKSYSLHPSDKMIHEWQEYSRRINSLIGTTIGFNFNGSIGTSDYFYGASYGQGQVLPPPSVLESKLLLNRDLRLLVHADPTFMAMNVLKKQFESVFGVSINSRALSIDRLRDEILSNGAAPLSNYDLIACDLPWFGEMAEAGYFLPIDGLIKSSKMDTLDFHSEAMASAQYRGIQYGIPVQTTPELLVYRRDVFESNGLAPPHTIEETLIAARLLHSKRRSMAGIAWNAARGTPLGHSCLYVMASFGQPALNLRAQGTGFDGQVVAGENFRPMFDSDGARDAAEYLQELLSYSPNGILSMAWYDRARAFADGNVGMAYCATLLAPLFEQNKKSPAYGVTEYLPLPNGPKGRPIAPVGGYALAIPSNVPADQISPIWTALMSLTSAHAIKLYLTNGSLVSPRFSVCMDPEVREMSPLISTVDNMARSNVLQMWPRPPVPEISKIIAIAGEEMHDMLMGLKSVSNALKNSQNRADALMRERGHY
jgi:multiple sugar transport system substrate-binding protein